jgi:hypothetical protein
MAMKSARIKAQSSGSTAASVALSSEVDTGSHKENASKT